MASKTQSRRLLHRKATEKANKQRCESHLLFRLLPQSSLAGAVRDRMCEIVEAENTDAAPLRVWNCRRFIQLGHNISAIPNRQWVAGHKNPFESRRCQTNNKIERTKASKLIGDALFFSLPCAAIITLYGLDYGTIVIVTCNMMLNKRSRFLFQLKTEIND